MIHTTGSWFIIFKDLKPIYKEMGQCSETYLRHTAIMSVMQQSVLNKVLTYTSQVSGYMTN
jgi:hypothetical protein